MSLSSGYVETRGGRLGFVISGEEGDSGEQVENGPGQSFAVRQDIYWALPTKGGKANRNVDDHQEKIDDQHHRHTSSSKRNMSATIERISSEPANCELEDEERHFAVIDDAGHQAIGSAALGHALSGLDQAGIACRMPERIVDPLETIEIE